MKEILEEHDSIDLRSKAFQEVLGKPPSWLQKWGITAVFVAFLALVLVGHFLKYPETIKATIKLETANPPLEIAATALGTISDYLPEDTLVESATILAHISDNSGDFQTILELGKELDTYNSDNKVLPNLDRFEISEIGNLQIGVFEYLQYFRGNNSVNNNYLNQALEVYNKNIKELEEEIVEFENLIVSKEAELEEIPTTRLSLQKIYGKAVNGKNRAALQQLRSDEKKLEDDIKIYQGKIAQSQRDIQAEELRKSSIKNNLQGNQTNRQERLELSLLKLKTEVENWKKQHIIKAPISGTLYHLDKLKSKDLLIEKGDKIFSIVPLGSQDSIEGKMYLRSEESVKVLPGQQVKIQFSAYNIAEYGLLNGVVTDKATIPKNGQYQITVAVEKDLITSKGKPIHFEHEMLGEANIITKERRFTGIIFDQFKEMLNR